MAGLSSVGETAVLTPLTASAYVSLHTADPSNAGGSEVTGGAYARQSVAFSNTGTNPTVAANTALITFPTASAGWGTVTHFGIWDAATVGNFRGAGALSASKVVISGDIARFAIGALTITAQ